MRIFIFALGILVAAVIAVAAAYAWAWEPALPKRDLAAAQNFSPEEIAKGARLAAIGNCASCHTADPGGTPYAGGRRIPTPFGVIVSTNLTPDPETGIGSWSQEAFLRAMHKGVDRSGRQLYPAFPYDHFNGVTDEDGAAIYAFLMSRSRVTNKNPPNELDFPFNIRPLAAGWKILFLRGRNLTPDPNKSAEWNRGRYLVEGLGHCGACHTPRNALGAERRNARFAGGTAENWDAPPIDDLAVNWTKEDLENFLASGWRAEHGVAAGPMADVTQNLSLVSGEDIKSIAEYMTSLSQPAKTAVSAPPQPAGEKGSPETKAIFASACGACHGAKPGASHALPLSTSSALRQPEPRNALQVVLHGIRREDATSGPFMPGFDGSLTDAQIADLVGYARERFAREPAWKNSREEIEKIRKAH